MLVYSVVVPVVYGEFAEMDCDLAPSGNKTTLANAVMAKHLTKEFDFMF